MMEIKGFPEAWRSLATSTFNVMNYGAVGNGQVDDTQVCMIYTYIYILYGFFIYCKLANDFVCFTERPF